MVNGKFIAFGRLIFIYESDSGEDVVPRFRALQCCDFLWSVFLRAFSFLAFTLVVMLSELKWLFKVMLESKILFILIDGDSQLSETWFIKIDWIYVNGLQFADFTTIVYTIYILIQSMNQSWRCIVRDICCLLVCVGLLTGVFH